MVSVTNQFSECNMGYEKAYIWSAINIKRIGAKMTPAPLEEYNHTKEASTTLFATQMTR